MEIIKRRRGTAIVEISKGILLTADALSIFILPGGGAKKGETAKNATIRELKEETGLNIISIKYFFKLKDKLYKMINYINIQQILIYKIQIMCF